MIANPITIEEEASKNKLAMAKLTNKAQPNVELTESIFIKNISRVSIIVL